MTGKLRAVFSILMLLVVSISSFYFWILEVRDYLEFHDEVVFSWMSLSLICIPIIFVFPLYWFFLSLRYEQKHAIKKMNKLIPFLKCACVFVFALSCSISFGYLSVLKNKGYILCSGVPSGWMPGTASKYVLDKNLCFNSERRNER